MGTLPALDHTPTVEEVQATAAMLDPVLRNLWITQSYHELALTVARRTGVAANWCTFATWASKQAGQTIRCEDLLHALGDVMHLPPFAVRPVWSVVAQAIAFGSKRTRPQMRESLAELLDPLAAIRRASDAVGRGNKMVFEEIGLEFARFAATCLGDAAFDADRIAQFCEGLRPGEPPDGQRYLRQAFARYYRAFFETDAKMRAELTLLANIEIGLHEQTRLQPEIAEAMNAAFLEGPAFRRRLIAALFPGRGWWARLRLFLLKRFGRPTPLEGAIADVWAEVRRQTRFVITEYMMTIELPGGVRLRLGMDLAAQFPPSLAHIALPDLQRLLGQLDPTPDSVRQSGALDWSELPDRLHFIVDMFRCYQESPNLFLPPFTPEQTGAIKARRVPPAPL